MSARSQVIVLCEDKQHRSFCERMLKGLGFVNYRTLPLPAGAGCAGAYVDQQFPKEAAAQRRRHSHAGCALLTMRDADTWSVADRLRALEQGLTPPRASDEHIAIFLPKRNIMTWIVHLRDGGIVDENQAYPELGSRESACHPSVERLIDIARKGPIPDNCPPSLRQTVESEYPRIETLRRES